MDWSKFIDPGELATLRVVSLSERGDVVRRTHVRKPINDPKRINAILLAATLAGNVMKKGQSDDDLEWNDDEDEDEG